jgi:hypothetical protein
MPVLNSTPITLGLGGRRERVSLEDKSKEFIVGDSTNARVNSRALRVLRFSLKVSQ